MIEPSRRPLDLPQDLRTIVVLSDVHGNLPALDAVIADLDAVSPEIVIVNGDMVNRGPQGAEVLDRIDELDWTMVLGNHDDLLRMWVDRDASLPPSWFTDPFWRSTAWCAERLERSGWLPRIAALPLTIAIEPPGASRLLVSHGSPRHYREGYGEHLADEAISEIVEMHPYDVLVGSHTHRPMERRWGRHLVLNSGAVGTPFNGDPRAQYLVLRRDGRDWTPEFRRVAYDRAAALSVFEDSGYLSDGGLSARLYWLEVATARSWLVPFLMWSEKNGIARGEASWRRFLTERGTRLEAPDDVGADIVARSGLAG
ncbi:MAG: metallophosphoesterase family protein [Trueperaceae bacterium]|nr:metallophosphoesterase family protein [Trueperaceae bacterium]